MAWACFSLNENRSIKRVLASSRVRDDRISLTTSSMWSDAMISPSRICALSSAFARSKRVRRITTSWRWSTNASNSCFRFSVWGRPFTKAILLTLKEDCKSVILNNLFKITLALASRFISITILIPARSDSSLMLEIPSNRFSSTKSAIFLINSDLLTAYGISDTTMVSRPVVLSTSISAFARITIRPRPVSKASFTPAKP